MKAFKKLKKIIDNDDFSMNSEVIILLQEAIEDLYNSYNIRETNEYVKVGTMQFESEIWILGENFRLFLKKNKRLKTDSVFENALWKIILEKKYKTGRQSFVLLLSDLKISNESKKMAGCLNDIDIYGHIISVLLKLKDFSYYKEVKQIYEEEKKGWIKQKCKKYIDSSIKSLK